MDAQRAVEIGCPYCGEVIEVLIDCTAGSQRYVEDCEVCCRPMHLSVTIDRNGDPFVDARRDDD
jgi:hypothetical protein